jgi:hypothetical protein
MVESMGSAGKQQKSALELSNDAGLILAQHVSYAFKAWHMLCIRQQPAGNALLAYHVTQSNTAV